MGTNVTHRADAVASQATVHRCGPGCSDHAPEAPQAADLGNRAARTLLAQPKLSVGASADPLEIEADRVASEVVRSLAAPSAAQGGEAHHCGGGCSHGTDVQRMLRRVADHGAPIGAEGGEVRAADEAAVNAARGGGSALAPAFRSQVEPLMGADFSRVRVHTGPKATQLNRSFGASAFTIGNDIFFRDGMPDVSSSRGAHLVTHELTHTIQQGAAPRPVARATTTSTDPHVQRHSSFEHLMLGDVKPTELAKIGTWQDAIQQTSTKKEDKKKGKKAGGGKAEASVDVVGLPAPVKKKDILHVLLQEMLRLKKWQDEPPKFSSSEQAQMGREAKPVGKDPEFEVLTIRLPQDILCTYGEMNTLGDYYGSVDVLKSADPKAVWQLLQSVREETWMFLEGTYGKLLDSLTKAERQDQGIKDLHNQYVDEIVMSNFTETGDPQQRFEGATAARISGMAGQIELIAGIQKTGAKGKTKGDKSNAYLASLGRNACHFVPESWHAWANNHEKARELALKSFTANEKAKQLERQRAERPESKSLEVERLRLEAAGAADEALMTNGFGDHYLQDSYAAGHMINKTQIMQWYIEYIDKKGTFDYFQDKNWRKVQNIAYTQNLAQSGQYNQSQVKGYGPNSTGKAMDPQSVENRSSGKWQENFNELGLQVPRSLATAGTPTRDVFSWFQTQASKSSRKAKGTVILKALSQQLGSDLHVVEALMELVADGVVRTDGNVTTRGRDMAKMRDSRNLGLSAGFDTSVEDVKKTTYLLRDDYVPKKVKKGQVAPERSEDEIQDQFKAITYGDYLEFIQSSFLQKSTNALHDTFCKGGLTVFDRSGTRIGKVYGDDSMFNEESSGGLQHSGTTANMSRDAIMQTINTGADGGNSQQKIIDRFPFSVEAAMWSDNGKKYLGSAKMDIAEWHSTSKLGNLKKTAFDKIFPTMNWAPTQKIVPGMSSTLGNFFTGDPPPHAPF